MLNVDSEILIFKQISAEKSPKKMFGKISQKRVGRRHGSTGGSNSKKVVKKEASVSKSLQFGTGIGRKFRFRRKV